MDIQHVQTKINKQALLLSVVDELINERGCKEKEDYEVLLEKVSAINECARTTLSEVFAWVDQHELSMDCKNIQEKVEPISEEERLAARMPCVTADKR